MLVYAPVGDQSEIKVSIMASAVNYAKHRQARENIEKHATLTAGGRRGKNPCRARENMSYQTTSP